MTAIKKSSKTSKEKLSTTDDILPGQNNGRLGTDGTKYRKKTQQGSEEELRQKPEWGKGSVKNVQGEGEVIKIHHSRGGAAVGVWVVRSGEA